MMRQIVHLIIFFLYRLGTAQVQPLIPIHPSLQGHLLRSRRGEILPNYQPTDSIPTYSDNGYSHKPTSHPSYVEVHVTPIHENDLPAYVTQKHLQSYEERIVATTETYLDPYEGPHSHNHDNVVPKYDGEDTLTTKHEILGLPSYSPSKVFNEEIHNKPNYLHLEGSHDTHSDFPSYSDEHVQQHIPESNYAKEDPLFSKYEEIVELPGYPSSLSYEEDIQNIPNYLHAEESHDSRGDLSSYSNEHSQENHPVEQADHPTAYNQQHNPESNYAKEDPLSSNYEEMVELPSYSSSVSYEEDIQNIPKHLHIETSHDSHGDLPSYSNEHSQENSPVEQSGQHNYPTNEAVSAQYQRTDYEENLDVPIYNAPSIIDLEHDPKNEHYEQLEDTHVSDYQNGDGLPNYSPTLSEDPSGLSHYEEVEPKEHGASVEYFAPDYEYNQNLPSYATRGQEETELQHYERSINYQDVNEPLPLYNEIESEGQAVLNYPNSHNVAKLPYTNDSELNFFPEHRYENEDLWNYSSDHPHKDSIYGEETNLYLDGSAHPEPKVHEERTTPNSFTEDPYNQFTYPRNEYIDPPKVVYQAPPTSYTAPGSYLAPEQTMPATDYVAPGEYPQSLESTSTTTTLSTTVAATTTMSTTPMPTTPAPIENDRSDSFQKITLTLVQSLTTLITNVLTSPPPIPQSPVVSTETTTQSQPQIMSSTPTLPPPSKTTLSPPTTSFSTQTSKIPEPVTTPMPTTLPLPSLPPSTPPPTLLLSTPPSPPTTTTSVPDLAPPTAEMEKMEDMKEITKTLEKMPVKMEKMPEQRQKMPAKMEAMPKKMEAIPTKMREMPEKMENVPPTEDKMAEKMEAMPSESEALPKAMDKMPPKGKDMPSKGEDVPPKVMDSLPKKVMPMTETMDVTTTPSSTLEQAVKDLDGLIQQLSTLAG